MEIILENRTLRWSTPSEFNDPFDTVQRLRIIGQWDEIREEISKYLWEKSNKDRCVVDITSIFGEVMLKLHRDVKEKVFDKQQFDHCIDVLLPKYIEILRSLEDDLYNQLIAKLQDAKILCMTKEFKNLLMWSHYADSHRGALLGFCQADDHSPWKMAKPVEYCSNLPIAFHSDQAKELLSGEKNIDHPDFLSMIIDRVVFSKSCDWQYEKELRIYAGSGRQKNEKFEDNPFGRNELEFIVFGCRASSQLISKCSRIVAVHYPHVQMYQAEQSQSSYSLEFNPLSHPII